MESICTCNNNHGYVKFVREIPFRKDDIVSYTV